MSKCLSVCPFDLFPLMRTLILSTTLPLKFNGLRTFLLLWALILQSFFSVDVTWVSVYI